MAALLQQVQKDSSIRQSNWINSLDIKKLKVKFITKYSSINSLDIKKLKVKFITKYSSMIDESCMVVVSIKAILF
jgi:hypothetical protein